VRRERVRLLVVKLSGVRGAKQCGDEQPLVVVDAAIGPQRQVAQHREVTVAQRCARRPRVRFRGEVSGDLVTDSESQQPAALSIRPKAALQCLAVSHATGP
jgi:hypothetical protein